MKETLTTRGRHLFGGAVHIFASEALLVPVGLLTAAYMSRRFGPEGYGLLTLAFAPVVLVESNVATALSRPAIRLIGGAPDGEWKHAGAAVLRPLIFGSLALLLVSVAASVLAAAGRERWTQHVAWPMLACAALGHALLIPSLGARGAAAVTALTACAGASASVVLVWRAWRVAAPPARTFVSSVAVAACAYALTALVPSAGLLLAPKLACACLFAFASLALLGEFGARRALRPLPA